MVTSPTVRELLRIRGLRKSFFGNEVLHGIDFDLRSGEVHGLVGENGAGKSTVMKILAGVHTADAGSVELDGVDVAFEHPLEAQQAGVTTVFQEFNLLPERTVAEERLPGPGAAQPQLGPTATYGAGHR